jgi:hypothetical protein
MGSISYKVISKGMTMQEAFDKAVESAEEEYGHDVYSGQINNSMGFIDVTASYRTSKERDLDDFIDKRLKGLSKFIKGEGICMAEPKLNNNKIKSVVDHIVSKGTKKWILLYQVSSVYDDYRECPKPFKTKGEAVNYSRKLSEKYRATFEVNMIKELEEGSTLVAKTSYKKGKEEREGTFVFYGVVSY